MQYTQLGSTDLNVSRICFGCWQLSPKFWGEVDLGPWETAVRQAHENGVNFIDTADAYGEGYAEEQLGRYLEQEKLRDHFVIATKFFWNIIDPDGRYPDTRHDYIIAACEASLKRLRTDHIDLYQIHSWDPITCPDEVARAFATLKEQGKVRYFGVSNQNPEQMSLYRAHFAVDCLQPPYSLLDRRIEARELPYCLQHNIGIINFSPLYRGLLGGRYRPGSEANDNRSYGPYWHGEGLRLISDALDEAQPIADAHGLTLAQLALRWTLTHPAVTSTIVGVKKPEHILGALPAADAVFDQKTWHQLAGIFAKATTAIEALPR
jgi:aryl-alcohol dehydrogenase-like predicted oxidoreductase